jgi:hypothetical protein
MKCIPVPKGTTHECRPRWRLFYPLWAVASCRVCGRLWRLETNTLGNKWWRHHDRCGLCNYEPQP